MACQAGHQDMLADYNHLNSQAAKVLKEKHGVKFLRLPDEILVALGNAAGSLLKEEREKLDPLGRKIWESYFSARKDLMALTEGADALKVNWCELTLTDAEGKVLYRNAFITDWKITPENVAGLIAAGRARWKIENQNNNVLKTKGYHLEHNFGHGKKHLASLLLTMNLLEFFRASGAHQPRQSFQRRTSPRHGVGLQVVLHL